MKMSKKLISKKKKKTKKIENGKLDVLLKQICNWGR